MKVVLTADVPNLGRRGDVKEVADGYARNFLFPRKLAAIATAAQLNQIEAQSAATSRRAAKAEAEHRALAERIAATPITLSARAGEQGRLYGSITNNDVATALSRELGLTIEKRQVDLPDPIRQAGSHQVKVKIARGIDGNATVIVRGDGA